jgi:hypothetical protein
VGRRLARTTVVYIGPAAFENKKRVRGNKHSEGETTISEGELNMAKKAQKKAVKKKVKSKSKGKK